MDIGLTVGDSLARIETTAEGFSFVEFGIGEAANIPENIDTDRLQSSLQQNHLKFDVHLPFKQVVATPVPEINRAIISYLERLLDWAGNLNARKAVLHGTARDPHDLSQRDFVSSQLKEIVAIGNTHGVEVVIENVGHQRHGLQLSVLGDIARSTESPICFDVGHAYMEDGHDGIKRFLKRYGDLVSHVHIHDVRGRGDTHMPLGAGEIEFDRIQDFLEGFRGSIAIEVFTDDVPLLQDSAERASRLAGR